jgi:indole-3-glycerol phosphate synthase
MKQLDIERNRPVISITESLKKNPFIAEIKRSSPSMGDIRKDADIKSIASLYQKGGAGAISVLTDINFFKGSYSDLSEVTLAVNLPVLCKDFIIDKIQIENAYRSGADCILLIAAVLEKNRLEDLSSAAFETGLEVLFELHEIDEMELLENIKFKMAGVNSRNLKTFNIDLTHASSVLKKIPAGYLRVAESGMNDVNDIRFMHNAGADAFLIGTALMKSDNPEKVLHSFAGGIL